jgi:hypothetical protein
VQQLEHDGEHAVEVAGPVRPLEHLAHRPGADPHERRAVGVDDVGRRREDDVGALARAHREVGLERARVAVEVLARPELQRVDEDGDDDVSAAAGLRAPARRGRVQRAHRHDDGDPPGSASRRRPARRASATFTPLIAARPEHGEQRAACARVEPAGGERAVGGQPGDGAT